MEPTIEELDIQFAELEKQAELKSSDAEKKVAAGIYGFVTEGFSATNTFVEGAKNLPNTRPDKYEFIVHAEANLVFWAAREGFALNNMTIVCTLSPCQDCIRTMFQAGVREVFYKDTYRKHNTEMKDIKITETPHGPYTKMVLENHE